MRIKVGTREVIASGSIICHDGDKLEFQFAPKITLQILLSPSDDKDAKPEATYSMPNPEVLQLKISNVQKTLGVGTSKPVKIGTLDTGELWFEYWIAALGEPGHDRLLHYSFFIGEVKNG